MGQEDAEIPQETLVAVKAARLGVEGVAGSNPVIPTINSQKRNRLQPDRREPGTAVWPKVTAESQAATDASGVGMDVPEGVRVPVARRMR